jgi:hypothetical protein
MSELMVPRALHVIGKMPMLGTGKIDIPAVERMIEISTEPAAQELVD